MRPLTRQDTQADPAFRELLHDARQVVQVASEATKLPDDQGIALA